MSAKSLWPSALKPISISRKQGRQTKEGQKKKEGLTSPDLARPSLRTHHPSSYPFQRSPSSRVSRPLCAHSYGTKPGLPCQGGVLSHQRFRKAVGSWAQALERNGFLCCRRAGEELQSRFLLPDGATEVWQGGVGNKGSRRPRGRQRESGQATVRRQPSRRRNLLNWNQSATPETHSRTASPSRRSWAHSGAHGCALDGNKTPSPAYRPARESW